MSYFAITAQYPIFADTDGTPLENGYVWIGDADENPLTNPIIVYWDSDLQTPASQPIRTLAGSPNRNGSPGQLYCATDFSILVHDKNDNQVFYSADGIKNYTTDSLESYRDYLINGKFDIQQYDGANSSSDTWITDVSGYALSETRDMIAPYSKPKDDLKFFMGISTAGLPGATSADYARYVTYIEDVIELSDQLITLSWYDRAHLTSPINRYAVSLTQKMPSGVGATSDVTGLGAQIFYPQNDFTLRSITVQLPPISPAAADALYFYSLEDLVTSGLLINFWLAAGSDYDSETNSLGNLTSGIHNLDITDVRLNKGSVIKDGNDLVFYERLNLCKRYYEKSNSIYDTLYASSVRGNGYISYVAGASTTIPGFRFTEEKRTQSPTVHVYSADDGAIDTVYRVGTGNVAVSSYNDVNSTGVGSITLGSATVANNVYQYHWSADDRFTI